MKKQPQRVALVCAGPIRDVKLDRLSLMPENLGWVKAISMQVASRASNTIRAGMPVHTYEELREAALFVLVGPDVAVLNVVDDMLRTDLGWPGKFVVAYQTTLQCMDFSAVIRCGAEVATLDPLTGYGRSLLLVEGSNRVKREIRHVLTGTRPAPVEFLDGGKQAYLDAMKLTEVVFPPLVMAILSRLRRSGVIRVDAEQLTKELISNETQAAIRAGSRVPRSPLDWDQWLRTGQFE